MFFTFLKKLDFLKFGILSLTFLTTAGYGLEKTNDRKNLSKAISSHDLYAVKDLIESSKVSIDELDSSSKTPLWEAVSSGDLETIQYLIDKGADVNQQNTFDRTLLYAAIERYDQKDLIPEIVKILIDKGADVNPFSKYEDSPFMKACSNNYLECVKLFIKANVDLEAQSYQGKTALMFATRTKKTDVVNLLVNTYHVNLETKDDKGQTALFHAIENESAQAIILLLKAGANINCVDFEKNSPFMLVISKGIPSLTQLFINKTQDFSQLNRKKQSALFFVAKTNDVKTAKLLISKGLDVNQKDDMKQTPIFNAIDSGHLLMFDFLIEQGANGSLQDVEKKSLAYIAAKKNKLIALQKLHDRKFPLDLPGPRGFTPLMYAILNCNFEMAKFLTDEGANLSAKTTEEVSCEVFDTNSFIKIPGFGKKVTLPKGSTAKELAEKLGYTDLAELVSPKP